MSLADDQILNTNEYNALDVLGGKVDKSGSVPDAIQAVIDFEFGIVKAKGQEERTGKTVVDPEAVDALPLDQQALLDTIKSDMDR